MSVIATAVKAMLAAGMAHDAIVAAVEAMEAAAAPAQTARQARNARYYAARKARLTASETVLIKTPKTLSDAFKTPAAPLSPSLDKDGPQTPKKTQPSPLPPQVCLFESTPAPAPAEPVEAVQATEPPKSRKHPWPAEYRTLFWKPYPRKDAKADGLKSLDKVYRSDEVPFDELLDGITRMIKFRDPKYFPYPATWLNGKHWEDEYNTAESSTHVAANRSPYYNSGSQPGGSFSHNVAAAVANAVRRASSEH